MILRGGAIRSIYFKQNLNTQISTEAKLNGADNASTMIPWMKLFVGDQGYDIYNKIL